MFKCRFGLQDHIWLENFPKVLKVYLLLLIRKCLVGLTSTDHVGIGSDYDGVGDSLPTGLKDVSSYPSLIGALLQRGYTENDIEKILGGNLLRVWEEVEAAATRLQADG